MNWYLFLMNENGFSFCFDFFSKGKVAFFFILKIPFITYDYDRTFFLAFEACSLEIIVFLLPWIFPGKTALSPY